MKKISTIVLILSTSLYSCVPQAIRVRFDPVEISVSFCDTNRSIRALSVYTKGPGNLQYSVLSDIELEEGKGSSKILLTGMNRGYGETIPIRNLKPNSEYKIVIPYLDVESELSFFTDSSSRISQVKNEYNCN